MIGLIDGGNFYRRCVHSVNAVTKYWDSMMLYDRFSQAIDEIISVLGDTKLVMALDAGVSWRAKYLQTYKSKNERESEINWDMVRTAQKDFTKNLMKHQCTISFAYDLEADDVIYGWVNKLKPTENIVIFSADSDLTQLLFQNKKNFCIQVDLINRKVFIPINKNYEENYEYSSYVLKLKNIFGLTIVNVDAFNVVLEKVLCGDKSDVTPSIYNIQKVTKAGARNYRYTEAKMHKALSNLNIENYDINNFNTKREIINRVRESLDNVVDATELQKNYESNVRLVYLDDTSYPHDIYEKLITVLKKDVTVFDNEGFKQIDTAQMIKEHKGFNAAYWTKYLDLDKYINGGKKPDITED
jgi:5'-3' exonuclease